MKKILALSLFIVLAQLAFAHPAKNINLEYDNETQLLKVLFQHHVKDNGQHFINDLKILNNKKEILNHKLVMQDDKNGGLLMYKIPGLKKGDILKVVIKCNKGGTKSAKLTIK